MVRPGEGATCASPPLVTTEIVEAGAFESLMPAWSGLFERVPDASPFLAPEWLLPWARIFVAADLWALAIYAEGRLVALAPLFIYLRPDRLRQVTLLGNGSSDRLDLLAEPSLRDAAATLVFDHLARNRSLWDCCDFRDLPSTSPLLGAPWDLPGHDWIEPDEPCPVLALPTEADSARLLAKSRLADLERCKRRLVERGQVVISVADDAGLEPGLEALIALHGRRWAARGEVGAFANPKIRAFHAAAAPGLLRRGMLRLTLLTLDRQVIAAHYGLNRGSTAFSYLHAFDPALAACAPGRLLMSRVLDDAVRGGAREFDFLRGREAYKYEWGAADRLQFRRRIRHQGAGSPTRA